jgi:hypothetical protein
MLFLGCLIKLELTEGYIHNSGCRIHGFFQFYNLSHSELLNRFNFFFNLIKHPFESLHLVFFVLFFSLNVIGGVLHKVFKSRKNYFPVLLFARKSGVMPFYHSREFLNGFVLIVLKLGA